MIFIRRTVWVLHPLSPATTFDCFVVRRCKCRRLCYVIIRLLYKCTWFWRNCGWTWEFGSSGFHGIMLRRFSKEKKKSTGFILFSDIPLFFSFIFSLVPSVSLLVVVLLPQRYGEYFYRQRCCFREALLSACNLNLYLLCVCVWGVFYSGCLPLFSLVLLGFLSGLPSDYFQVNKCKLVALLVVLCCWSRRRCFFFGCRT